MPRFCLGQVLLTFWNNFLSEDASLFGVKLEILEKKKLVLFGPDTASLNSGLICLFKRRIGGGRYSSTHSQPQHQTKVRSWSRAQAPLTPTSKEKRPGGPSADPDAFFREGNFCP